MVVVVFGESPGSTRFTDSGLAPRLSLQNGSMRVGFKIPTPAGGPHSARGFWIQSSLQKHLFDLLKGEGGPSLAANQCERLLSKELDGNPQARHLLSVAPELDGEVRDGKGRLEARFPEGTVLPTESEFLAEHPLLLVAVLFDVASREAA